MIKAITWDFDNTLVNSNEAFREHLSRTCNRLYLAGKLDRIPTTEEVIAVQRLNLNMETTFDELFGREGKEVLLDYRTDSYTSLRFKETPCGNKAVLNFALKGLKQGILTNRLNYLKERLKEAGYILDNFSFYFVPENGIFKPNPKAFAPVEKFYASHGIDLKDTVYIGDHPHDYLAAKERRINFYANLTGLHSREEFLDLGLEEEKIVNNLGELITALI